MRSAAVVALGDRVLADANQAVGERLPIRLSHADSIPRGTATVR